MTVKKYKRTFHLPWSLGATNDDKTLSSTNHFHGKMVVVTEKMDGENTTMMSDRVYARSIDSKYHPSRTWVQQLHSQLCWQIPPDYRICGENLYAKHSIAYDSLESFFMVFAVFDEDDQCLSWPDSTELCATLGVKMVPTIYTGIYDAKLETMLKQMKLRDNQEGYVVRLFDAFPENEFQTSVAKFVRQNHVQTSSHWMHSKVIRNAMKS